MKINTDKGKAIANMLGLRTDLTYNADAEKDSRDMLEERLKVEEIIDILEDYNKDVREELFYLAEQEGITDEKGSSTVQYADGSGFKKEARVKVKVNPEKAQEVEKEKGVKILGYKPKFKGAIRSNEEIERMKNQFGHLVEFDEEVDEEYLEKLYYEGVLKDEDLDEMVDREVTYALKKLKAK